MTILRLDGANAVPAMQAVQQGVVSLLNPDDVDKLTSFASLFSGDKDNKLNLGDIANKFVESVNSSPTMNVVAMPSLSM